MVILFFFIDEENKFFLISIVFVKRFINYYLEELEINLWWFRF